jgi:hypothetical protein
VDALQLAFELDFPPCVLLRRLLEHLQLGLAKERITKALRQPDLLPTLVSPEALQKLAAEAACSRGASSGDSAGLEPAQQLMLRLQRDVEACLLCDRVYSPASGEHATFKSACWHCRNRLHAPSCPQLSHASCTALLCTGGCLYLVGAALLPPLPQMRCGTARGTSTRSG